MTGGLAERRILLACIFATGAIFVDISVVNVVLPDLRLELHTSLAEEQWIINAYLVTMTAFVLPSGVLGDVYGHRRLLQWGLGLFAIATLFVGLAPTPLLEILARGLQGIAAALMTPASIAILRTAIPKDRQARAVGVWAMGTSISSAAGPVIGGIVGGLFGWRWAFLVVIPILLAALWFSKSIPETQTTNRRVDIAGGILAALTIGLAVAALIEWPVRGISDPLVLAIVAAGIAAGALFVLHERRFTDPMIPVRAVKDRALNTVHLYTILAWSTPLAALLLVSIQLQSAAGLGPIGTGFMLLPMSLVVAALATWLTRVAAHGRMLVMLRIGPLITALSIVPALFIDASHPWMAVVATVLMGVGMACMAGPVTHAVLQLSPHGDEGMQSAINLAAARFGTLIAIALIGIAAAVGWSLAGGGAVPANPLSGDGSLAQAAYRAALVMIAVFALAAIPFATSAVRQPAAAD